VDIRSALLAATSAKWFHRGICVPYFAVAVMAGNHLLEIQHVGNLDVHAMFAYFMFYVAQCMLVVA
jgi:hypothetical protein